MNYTSFRCVYLCYKRNTSSLKISTVECQRFNDEESANTYFFENIGPDQVDFSTLILECKYKPLFLVERSLKKKISSMTNHRIDFLLAQH